MMGSLLHRVVVRDDSIEVQVRKHSLLRSVLGQDLDTQAGASEDDAPGPITLRLKHSSNAAVERSAFCCHPTRLMPRRIPFLRSSVLWPEPIIG